jgi:hypothetical protein
VKSRREGFQFRWLKRRRRLAANTAHAGMRSQGEQNRQVVIGEICLGGSRY